MLQGLNFTGKDINPLAVLLCRTKSGPMDIEALERTYSDIWQSFSRDHSETIDVSFQNRDKWFRNDVAKELSKIRRAILNLSELWIRRFFWVGLAETVRLTSNSRTSNFKLYTLPRDKVTSRQIFPLGVFNEIIVRNIKHFKEHRSELLGRNLLHENCYKKTVNIILGNSMSTEESSSFDLLITSPPYGDNNTTVTYGQSSYLPLQWLDMKDIDSNANSSYLASTHEIDRRSLGGYTSPQKLDHSLR